MFWTWPCHNRGHSFCGRLSRILQGFFVSGYGTFVAIVEKRRNYVCYKETIFLVIFHWREDMKGSFSLNFLAHVAPSQINAAHLCRSKDRGFYYQPKCSVLVSENIFLLLFHDTYFWITRRKLAKMSHVSTFDIRSPPCDFIRDLPSRIPSSSIHRT